MFLLLTASGIELLCGLVPSWLRRMRRLLAFSAELLGSPRECLGVLRGRLGEALGSFGDVLEGFRKLLEAPETPLGASGASQGGSWLLLE